MAEMANRSEADYFRNRLPKISSSTQESDVSF